MKTDNLDSENKNTIGAFSASPSPEKESDVRASEIQNEFPADSSTIDSRLEKIAPVVSVTPSVTIESVLPEHLQQFNKKAAVEEVRTGPLKSDIEKTPLHDGTPHQEESSVHYGAGSYHTISGGQETYKDSNEKKATTIIEQRPYSTIGIPNSTFGIPLQKKEKEKSVTEESSLFVLFFKITFLVLVLFLGVAFSAPYILPILVDNGYLTLVGEGVYSIGESTFSNAISGQILYLTSLLVAGILLVLSVALIVDLLVRKSIFLFAKVFIFIIIVLLLGVLVFYLEINGTHIVGPVHKQFEVFK